MQTAVVGIGWQAATGQRLSYHKLGNFSVNIILVCLLFEVSKFRCSGACSHMEQGLSLCPDFVVQGTHENKLTMKISQITVYLLTCLRCSWL